MTTKKSTVTVDAGAYSEYTPDYFTGDEIDITIKAFEDSVYLDFPDWSRVERKIRSFMNNDTPLYGHEPHNEHYPVDRSEIETREDAIELLFDILEDFDRDEQPEKTTQYCVKYKSAFKVLVSVCLTGKDGDIKVKPYKRHIEEHTYEDGHITMNTHISPEHADREHLKVVETFCEIVDDVTDDKYWHGYRDGRSSAGKNSSWSELMWQSFENNWDGDIDTMLELGKFFAKIGQVPCNRKNVLFDIPVWSTPTGSYVNTISSVVSNECPKCGTDKDECWECTESSNQTRVPNSYKCTECGFTKKGITTG